MVGQILTEYVMIDICLYCGFGQASCCCLDLKMILHLQKSLWCVNNNSLWLQLVKIRPELRTSCICTYTYIMLYIHLYLSLSLYIYTYTYITNAHRGCLRPFPTGPYGPGGPKAPKPRAVPDLTAARQLALTAGAVNPLPRSSWLGGPRAPLPPRPFRSPHDVDLKAYYLQSLKKRCHRLHPANSYQTKQA